MQKVYTHENLAIVTSARNLLAINGIDSFIKNEYHGAGGHVGLEAVPIELWVQDPGRAGEAVSILEKELGKSDNQPEWQCPGCGEINAGSFEFCWNCQAAPTDKETP